MPRARRARRAPRRKLLRRRRVYRKKTNTSMRVFTETVDAGALTTNTGGIFAPAINSIPQIVQYTTLYTEYCIKKIEVILVPNFGAVDYNSQQYNQIAGVPNAGEARITYAVQESTDTSLPITELDVLQMNGCKMRSLTRPVRMYSNKPVPSLYQYGTGGFVEYVNTNATKWLALSSPQVVPWMGLKYWITSVGNNYTCVNAYYKITFAVRDPR